MADGQPDVVVADSRVEYAEKSGTHLWVTRLDFATDTETLNFLDSADDDQFQGATSFDVGNLVRPPAVVCSVCDDPYERRLRDRRCKGPRDTRVGGYRRSSS